jgi:hypothetical protein
MSLPARVTDFIPFTTIFSNQFDAEFDNLVNMLNGTDQSKNIRIRSNDSTLAVARFDQLAASGNIVEFYSGGVEAAKVDKTGKITSTSVVKLKHSWFVPNPFDSGLTIDNGDNFKVFTVPVGTAMKLTKFSIIRVSGSHTSGSIMTARVKKNAVNQGSGVVFSDTNNAANTEYFETLSVSVVSGDKLEVTLTFTSGSALTERDISLLVEWEQQLS